jgi:hypothetical protein
MPFGIFESTVVMEILSCCLEGVVAIFYDWVGGNLE